MFRLIAIKEDGIVDGFVLREDEPMPVADGRTYAQRVADFHAAMAGFGQSVAASLRAPEVILADQVRDIVAARFAERRVGILANEAEVNLANGVAVSVLRTRGLGIPIVRVNGVVVLHQWDGTFERGEWESVVATAAAELETEQLNRPRRPAEKIDKEIPALQAAMAC